MKVVVMGAGYAGMIAANRLANKVKTAKITVINPRPDFVERIRLHQQIAQTGAAAAPLTSMLPDRVASRVGTVDKIGDGTVSLEDGKSADFDYAFLAVGSTALPMQGSVPVGTWEGAEQARVAFAALSAGSAVTVIGGGMTGIETAAEVAEARPDVQVRLIGSSVAGSLSDGARQRVRDGLERLNVDIVDDEVTEVSAGAGQFDGVVHLHSGAAFTSALTLWAIVGGTPDLASRSGLEVSSEGRAIVDEFLRSVSDERIFAVGDCAAVPGARLACQSAAPQAAHAADNLAFVVNGGKPRPYSQSYFGLGLSLGRKDAVAQFLHRDDTVRRIYFAGHPATVLNEVGARAAKFVARTGIGA